MNKPEPFRTGYITVSQPRVWQDHAVMTSVSMQLGKINDFEGKVDLSAIQGKRARRYYQVLGLKGAVDLQFPIPTGAAPSTTTPATPAAEGGKKPDEGEQVLPRPTLPENVTVKVFPNEKQATGLEIKEFPADVKEDPFDGLQRVDDFYQILSGVRLTHLRDTASMQRGWSVYLLGFDISLVPGSKTSKDYSACVEFELTGKKDDKVTNNEKIRVYSVWPQRYAERFNETLSRREDFQLALKAAAQSPKGSAEMAQDLAQRYEDDSALIQRYPLISGFVRGGRSFGWEFNPRLRIVTKRRFILPGRPRLVYWMEPGVRHCYVLVAVNDGRIEADKTLLMMSEEDLKSIAFGGKAGLTDLPGLKKMYEGVLEQLPEKPAEPKQPEGEIQDSNVGIFMALRPEKEKGILEEALQRLFNETLGEKDDLNRWNDFQESLKVWQDNHTELTRLMEQAKCARPRKLFGFGDNDLKRIASGKKVKGTDLNGIKELYDKALQNIEKILEKQEKPAPQDLKDYFGSLENHVVCVDAKDLAGWEKFSEWVAFHRRILDLCGNHGEDGIRRLELSVSSCHWFNLHNGKKVEVSSGEVLGASNPMVIELPNKLDRTLEQIWPVRPNWGLTNQETTVTIKGENFSTDARVFVGGREVDPKKVSVVGKDFIVATFPRIPEELLEGANKKTFAVKVITGGDSLTAGNAFTYIKPKVKGNT